MLQQLLDHCTQQDLIPVSQSAYRKNYSTETSLIKMTNDILLGFENQNITSIVILDLLAGFDIVDHVLLTYFKTILDSREQHSNGFKIIFIQDTLKFQ